MRLSQCPEFDAKVTFRPQSGEKVAIRAMWLEKGFAGLIQRAMISY